MNYIEKIDKLLDTIDVGDSIFTIDHSDSHVKVKEDYWSFSFETEGFYEKKLLIEVSRKFNKISKKYEIVKDIVQEKMKYSILFDAVNIFSECSPTKYPTRTKAYKKFRIMLNEKHNTADLIDALFNVSEYYYNVVKKNGNINHISNDVHRKNIYQIFCLMEKKYA